MLRIRETFEVNGTTLTLVASKCVLGGDWGLEARDIKSDIEVRADSLFVERHASGASAIKAGRAWADKTFG